MPAGTVLTPYYGDLVITTPGASYDALDVHGFVKVKAPNVTITRSVIRGGVQTTGSTGIVSILTDSATNFVLRDSELVPEHPSVAIDGIMGWNYTMDRVNVHGTVDTAKVFGSNVKIENSWLHDTVSYPNDPYQSGGPTHNDGVQVLSGSHILISHNTIAGGTNSALQITQDRGVVSDLTFTDNWADFGACTANIADKPLASMAGIELSHNRFGHTSQYNCPIILSSGVSMVNIDNTWVDTHKVVPVTPRA